jgi:RNA polymerase sigma-70 factor (ECF subfamily)
VQALRDGDERAFARMVDMYGASMLRVARLYVRDAAVAQEVVQDAWLALLRGLDRFEGRSSLRTWLFSILVNVAKTRGVRESRSIPFSAFAADADDDGPSVPAGRFGGEGDPWPGHWATLLRTGIPRWSASFRLRCGRRSRRPSISYLPCRDGC